MCAGLPVVCSQYADGGSDLIEEGVNGYITDPYDTVQFHNCLKELLENPDRSEKMGRASFQHLERFRFKEVSKGFMEAVRLAEDSQTEKKG